MSSTTAREATHVVLVIRRLVNRSGGAERIYCELANMLVEAGYRVTCLHFDKHEGHPFFWLNSRIELINLHSLVKDRKRLRFVKTLISNMRNREKAEWEGQYRFFIKQLKEYYNYVRPDVVISLLPTANTPALIASVGTQVKVIPTNHNVPQQDYENPTRWGRSKFDRQLRLSSLDQASAIHVLFDDFRSWFPSSLHHKILAIPNYVSPQFTPRQTVRENTILCVGRLVDVKNYVDVIHAWSGLKREHPNWTIKIYGSGPQRKFLQSEIDKFDLQDCVLLLGDNSDLSVEYARASIFCHPALFEGFGLAPAEALYMGCPVVSYADCSGVNQFVRNGINGLAIERGNDNLRYALRDLIKNPRLRAFLGNNGPSSVAQFSLESYRDQWTMLIDNLARKKH